PRPSPSTTSPSRRSKAPGRLVKTRRTPNYPDYPAYRLLLAMEDGRALIDIILPRDPDCGDGHSPDFRSFNRAGQDWRFSPTQAAVVKGLCEAEEAGRPEVGGELMQVGEPAHELVGAGRRTATTTGPRSGSAAWASALP